MNGSREHRYAKNWERLSMALRKRYPCAICGENEFKLKECHHIDNDKRNGAVKNAVVLCSKHHVQVHKGKAKIPDDFKPYDYTEMRVSVIRARN